MRFEEFFLYVEQVVENILDKNPNYVTAIDEDLYTPLHRASYNGHTEVMRVLLKHGADPNAPTLEGWTPLHSGTLEKSRPVILLKMLM